MIEEEKNQFAVLIDADNISPKYAPIIFQELEAYGFPSCRRIYGNSVSYTHLDVYKRQVLSISDNL